MTLLAADSAPPPPLPQLQLHDRQRGDADHWCPEAEGRGRASPSVPPTGGLRPDGGCGHRSHPGRAVRRHPGGHTAG